MNEWLNANSKNPYASNETKRELAFRANIPVFSVSYWLNNTRKKIKAKKPSKHFSLDQKNILLQHYNNFNGKISREELKRLSIAFNKPEKRIATWFYKKRFNINSTNKKKIKKDIHILNFNIKEYKYNYFMLLSLCYTFQVQFKYRLCKHFRVLHFM